jgi:hypothetical protein
MEKCVGRRLGVVGSTVSAVLSTPLHWLQLTILVLPVKYIILYRIQY